MNIKEKIEQIDFSVDKRNLYKEEAFTDMKGASIRRFTPIKLDGSRDKKRDLIYLGHTQLFSNHGPVPVQCVLKAKTINQAMDNFPSSMKKAVEKVLKEIDAMEKKTSESRIIMPGQ